MVEGIIQNNLSILLKKLSREAIVGGPDVHPTSFNYLKNSYPEQDQKKDDALANEWDAARQKFWK